MHVTLLTGLLALGMALISPNLTALISTRGGSRRAGTALGAQNAANSFGQASGAVVGGALFVWRMNAPYVLSGGLLTHRERWSGLDDAANSRHRALLL